jgi:prepilin-type N-terminal cleavage/methylation domain-containing protein
MAKWAEREGSPQDAGFSLVELLIVVIIMGILAAVAIPLFFQQRSKAEDAGARSDVRALAHEVATFWSDHPDTANLTISHAGGRYTLTSDVAGEQPIVTPASQGIDKVTYGHLGTGTEPKRETWCVSVRHPGGVKKIFSVSAANGLREGSAIECGSLTGT